MHDAYLFLTDGFEETEAVAPIDILRRGGVNLATVSITGGEFVTGAHGVTVKADFIFEDLNIRAGGGLLILPGGPGTKDCHKHNALLTLLKAHHEKNGKLAALCAAPSVLGRLGILEGKRACCYPGYEAELKGATVSKKAVETDCNVTTSRSAATAFIFGLELLKILKGEETAEKVRLSMPVED